MRLPMAATMASAQASASTKKEVSTGTPRYAPSFRQTGSDMKHTPCFGIRRSSMAITCRRRARRRSDGTATACHMPSDLVGVFRPLHRSDGLEFAVCRPRWLLHLLLASRHEFRWREIIYHDRPVCRVIRRLQRRSLRRRQQTAGPNRMPIPDFCLMQSVADRLSFVDQTEGTL